MHTNEEIVSKLIQAMDKQNVDDAQLQDTGLSVMLEGCWIPADRSLWRSWVGRRALWGIEYHGPIFDVESKNDDRPYEGPRNCGCKTCQSSVEPASRKN